MLRELYVASRAATFTWMDATMFTLADFDTDTAAECIWVASRNDKVQGFISVWLPDHFIHCLYVNPAATGRGIGSALLKYCLAHIGRPARLKCKIRNTTALRFYEAHGWETIAEAGTASNGGYYLMSFS